MGDANEPLLDPELSAIDKKGETSMSQSKCLHICNLTSVVTGLEAGESDRAN